MTDHKPSFVFFGTPDFSVTILETLRAAGHEPVLIVTAPDRKVGRKQILTPPPVKVWGLAHDIPVIQPSKVSESIDMITELVPDLCIVASYGYIIPQRLLDIPRYGTLNVHTSLLPRYRGASPIESAILHGDSETGSTIMLMDAQMDHGPILSQEWFDLDPHTDRLELFTRLAKHGGELLVRTLPSWLDGDMTPKEQDHDAASYCHKIQKSDGDITHDADATRYRKYLAYKGWPGVFYFDKENKRIKISEAEFINSTFVIKRVIPEGKKEMEYSTYLASSR